MNNLKNNLIASFFILSTLLMACSKDDGKDAIKPELEVKTVADLDASSQSAYFSLRSGTQVTGDDTTSNKWDIKLKSTTLSFNKEAGVSAQFLTGTIESVALAPEDEYLSDDIKGSGSWYNYTANDAPAHAILAIPGKILIVKTADGTYAKLEMISYYKGNPDTSTSEFADLGTRPASGFFTFNFAHQADGSRDLK